jgi:hypothetical protein
MGIKFCEYFELMANEDPNCSYAALFIVRNGGYEIYVIGFHRLLFFSLRRFLSLRFFLLLRLKAVNVSLSSDDGCEGSCVS